MAAKYEKAVFKRKGHSQGHKVINLDVIWKGIISGVSMPNMKSFIFYNSKDIVKVKVDNRQTNRQDKTLSPPPPPNHSSWVLRK